MAEWTTGLYRLVGIPAFYKAFQNTLGASKGRERLVQEIIRPQPDARVLDLGCGSAAILEAMPDGIRYVGIDHNARHIETARAAFGKRAVFHAGNYADATALSDKPYDLVLALGLLHHLEDDQAEELMRLSYRALAPGGRFFSIDPAFAPGQSPIAHFLIRNDSGRNVRDAAGYVGLAQRVFKDVRSTIRHDLLRVPYTHCLLELYR